MSIINFDPSASQRLLGEREHGLRSVITQVDDLNRQSDGQPRMVWNWARMGHAMVVEGIIAGSDHDLIVAARRATDHLAQYSLDAEQWRGWIEIVPEEDYLKRGRQHQIDHPDRPRAFIAPNLVLLHNHWLDTGAVDRVQVDHMFSQPMAVPAVQGVMGEHEIMPLSAWPQIQALGDLPDPGGNRRPKDAGHRIGQMLAADPAQLHDPKSPVRKKARTYMRQSMSRRWLAGGLAVEAMNWLQTFEWREGESGLSPIETMLRAYAYMPEVDPPANIAVEVERLRKLVV